MFVFQFRCFARYICISSSATDDWLRDSAKRGVKRSSGGSFGLASLLSNDRVYSHKSEREGDRGGTRGVEASMGSDGWEDGQGTMKWLEAEVSLCLDVREGL